MADLSDWESLRVQLNLPDVEGEDRAGDIGDSVVASDEADQEPAEGDDLPVLYPEGVEEQLEEIPSDDDALEDAEEDQLAVSEWPEPVG